MPPRFAPQQGLLVFGRPCANGWSQGVGADAVKRLIIALASATLVWRDRNSCARGKTPRPQLQIKSQSVWLAVSGITQRVMKVALVARTCTCTLLHGESNRGPERQYNACNKRKQQCTYACCSSIRSTGELAVS